MSRTLRWLGVGVWLLVILGACAGPAQSPTTPTAIPPFVPTPSPTPTVTPAPILRVWAPPELAADAAPGGSLLRQQLEGFALAEGLTLDLRLKPVEGPGGMLPTLAAATLVAPEALPEVLLLPRPALETAALKGWLQPLADLDAALPAAWQDSAFSFAHRLGLVQSTLYGQLLGAQALGLLYPPDAFPEEPPQVWAAVYDSPHPVRWAAGDPQALFVLGLYQAAGGPLRDAEGRPTVEPGALTAALEVVYRLALRGQAAPALLQVPDDGALWQAYGAGQNGLLVTDITLAWRTPSPWQETLVPGLQTPAERWSLAWGYLWAVPAALPEARQARAARLLRSLGDPVFLGQWSAAAGFLPPHPDAVVGWDPTRWAQQVRPFATAAQPIPEQDVLQLLGPVLQQAAAQVLQGLADPATAAARAAAQVVAPASTPSP